MKDHAVLISRSIDPKSGSWCLRVSFARILLLVCKLFPIKPIQRFVNSGTNHAYLSDNFSASDSVNAAKQGKNERKSDPLNMNVIVPPIIACRQTKLGSTAALLVGASVLVFCLTLPLAQQHQMIGQRANSSGDLYHPTLTDISTPKTGSVSNSVSDSLSSDTFHALSKLDHKF